MRGLTLLTPLLLSLAVGCAAAAAEASPAELSAWEKAAAALFANPYTARGDADGALLHHFTQAARHIDTPVAELALRLALDIPVDQFSRPDLGAAEALRLVADLANHPAAGELALAYHLQALERAGRAAEAEGFRRTRQARGRAAFAWRSGPWGSTGPADFHAAWPPETDAGAADWRPFPGGARERFAPWQGIAPGRGYVAYALGRVEADPAAAGDALLETSADGDLAVLVDGLPAVVCDRLAVETPRRALHRFRLSAGAHWVLVKLSRISSPDAARGSDPWASPAARIPFPPVAPDDWRDGDGGGATLRILDLRGRPLAGLRWIDPADMPLPDGYQPPVGGWRAAPTASEPMEEPLRAAARLRPDSAPLQAAWAATARWLDCPDEALLHAEEAARLDPAQPAYALLAASAALGALDRPAAWRRQQARAHYQRALAVQPGHLPALLGLADLMAASGDAAEANRLVRRAQTLNPRSLAARTARLRAACAGDRRTEARALLAGLRDDFPAAPALSFWHVRAGMLWNDAELLGHAASSAAPEAPDTTRGRLFRASLYGATGRQREAEALLRRVEADSAAESELALAAAAYSAWGDWESAVRVWTRALERAPDRALWRRAAGDDARRLGDAAAALAQWRKSLELDPSQHDLRGLIQRVSGEPFDWRAGLVIDWAPLAASVRDAPPPGSVARLVDQEVVTLWADGSGARHVHEVDLALTPAGAGRLSEWPFRGEVLAAHTILPDGVRLEPFPQDASSTLILPGLRTGAIREGLYLESFPAPAPGGAHLPPWYFRHPERPDAFLRSEYAVRFPKNRPPATVEKFFDAVVERRVDDLGDGFRLLRWTARQPSPPAHEPGAADPAEWLPHVIVARPVAWSEVARAGAGEWLGSTRVTGDLRIEAARLAGAPAPADPGAPVRPPDDPARREGEIRALHAWVCAEINDLPLDTPAGHILRERGGRRDLLLLALLRARGYDADLAAVRPGPDLLVDPPWTLPRLEHFPLRLVTVGPDAAAGRRVWLDLRHAAADADDPPEDLSDATALILSPGGETLSRLPSIPWETYRSEWTLRADFPDDPDRPDARLRLEGRRVRRGTEGYQRKAALRARAPEGRFDDMEIDLAKWLPAPTLLAVDWPELENPGSECIEAFYAALSASTLPPPLDDGRMAVPLFLPPLALAPEEALRLAVRRSPFHLRRPVARDDRVVLEPPAGAVLERLPPDVMLPGRFGTYQLRVRRLEGSGVEITRKCVFRPQRIAPSDWPEFVDALRRIDRAEAERIEWRRAP